MTVVCNRVLLSCFPLPTAICIYTICGGYGSLLVLEFPFSMKHYNSLVFFFSFYGAICFAGSCILLFFGWVTGDGLRMAGYSSTGGLALLGVYRLDELTAR